MSFFKPSGNAPSSKSMAQLHKLIWILVYGGLLTAVLGIFVQRIDPPMGWAVVVVGAVAAVIGFALIYVRARINAN